MAKKTVVTMVGDAQAFYGKCDREQRLNNAGWDQTGTMCWKLVSEPFDIAFVSIAFRAQETLRGILGGRGPIPTYVLPELYELPGEDGKAFEQMRNELSCSPLACYHMHGNASVLERYAEQLNDNVGKILRTRYGKERPNEFHMLFVGRPVLLNEAARVALEGCLVTGVELVLNTRPRECEGFRITVLSEGDTHRANVERLTLN